MARGKVLSKDYYNQKILNDSLAALRTYKTEPFTISFLEHNQIKYPAEYTVDDLHDIIRRRIRGKKPPFLKDLVEYTDHLRMWGRQHIFLFYLDQKHHQQLEALRDPEYVRGILKNLKLGNRFNRNLFIWDAPEPTLAEVRHHYDQAEGGELFFKWVETREYIEKIPDKVGLRRPVLRKERSVNFLIIDLKNGNAQLRIQILQNIAEDNLRRQHELYKEEINNLISFELFSIVPMQPIVRQFLTKPMLQVNNWKMEYIAKRQVNGNGDPSIFSKVVIPFQNFLGKWISLSWKCEQMSQGREFLNFYLNGETDEIRFVGVTDKLRVDYILERLRSHTLVHIELKELKELAEKYPQYHRIFAFMDFLFARLKMREITVKELEERLWFKQEVLQKVVNIVAGEYPKKFCLKDGQEDVLIMKNRFSISGGLRDYMKRGAEKKKHKTLLKNMVTPFLSLIYILLFMFKEEWGEWLKEAVWDAIFTDFPFIYFKIFLFVIIAVLFLGSKTIFKKLPRAVVVLLMKVGFNFNPDHLSDKLKNDFDRWSDN